MNPKSNRVVYVYLYSQWEKYTPYSIEFTPKREYNIKRNSAVGTWTSLRELLMVHGSPLETTPRPSLRSLVRRFSLFGLETFF